MSARGTRLAVEPLWASRGTVRRRRRSRVSGSDGLGWRVLFEPPRQDPEDPQRQKANQRISVERAGRFEMDEIHGRRRGCRQQTGVRGIYEPVPFCADDELGHRQARDGLGRLQLASEQAARREARCLNRVSQADLAALTQWLKLDQDQQMKTRELLDQLAQRNALIREKWEQQHRVRQEEWLASRSIFLHDLAAILTEEQQRLWAQANLKMQVMGRRRPSN